DCGGRTNCEEKTGNPKYYVSEVTSSQNKRWTSYISKADLLERANVRQPIRRDNFQSRII
ncbi:MAG: hypothetical protein ACK53Y_07575, partial [bacterium]